MLHMLQRILARLVGLLWSQIDRAERIPRPLNASPMVDEGVTSDAPLPTRKRHAKLRRRARFIGELASVLMEHYHCNGTVALLVAASHLYEGHLKLIVVSNPSQISVALARVGDVLFALYEQNWDVNDLERSIGVYKKAFSCSEVGSPGHCDIEAGLAWGLWRRFQYYSTKDDCRMAVQILEVARDRVGVSPAEKARILPAIGRLRFQSITRSVVPATSQDMIDTLAMLVEIPKDNLSQSHYITCLIAEAYLNMQLSVSSMTKQYLDDGIRVIKQALRFCPEQAEVLRYSAEMILCSLHFRASLHFQSDLTARESHIDTAIEVANHMKSVVSQHDTNLRYLGTLGIWGMVFGIKSDRLYDLDGLESAVNSLKHALSMCPPAYAKKPHVLNNLVAIWSDYHKLSGRVSVLDESIALHDLGYDYLSQSPFLATNIAELALRRARISDTNTAMTLISQAIQLCQHRKNAPGFAVDRAIERIDVDMCMIYAVRLQIEMGIHPLLLDPVDLIHVCDQDLQLLVHLPAENFSRIELVVSQAELLKFQAIANNDIYALQEAERLVNAELNVTGELVALQWSGELLSIQADLLVARSNVHGKDEKLLTGAWETYQRAVQISQSDGHRRFQTCLRWASQAVEQGDLMSASTAYTHAISLLPNVVFLGEDVIGRVEALRRVSGLSVSSVAVALSLGQIDVAIEFVESTRGILWSQSLQTRAPQLKLLPDALRDHFVGLVREIEEADRLQLSIRRRREEELQKVASQIRAMPGCERFLLPPLLTEIEGALQHAGGYAIIVALSDTSCDVLSLGTPGGHSHLRLGTESLDLNRLRAMVLAFGAMYSTARDTQRKDSTSRKIAKASIVDISSKAKVGRLLMAELWISLVYPVIRHLNILRASNRDCRKRVWWCPIGALGSLPLHAAGVYDGLAQDSADNYLISSYTPTLSTLHRLLVENAAVQAPLEPATFPTVLLVAQPDAVDLPLLPNARREVELIRALIPSNYFVDQSDSHDALVDTALKGASIAHVIHLACHGHQDQENPLNSGFDLKDGRLTLGQLMHAKAPHAQLAYLSSCESAGLDQTRPDEGLNLVGAMIFAGFKSVIGTMWTMDDIDGPFMAQRIYSRIFRDGFLDMAAVPHAVDDAVRELRDSGVPACRWATYVHFGV